MTAPRPKCVNCGAAYGRRDGRAVSVTWKAGEEMPEYQGTGILLREHTIQNQPVKTEIERNVMYPQGREIEIGSKEARGWYEVWDGKSWIQPYKPFCTLRCALDYARRAYRERR